MHFTTNITIELNGIERDIPVNVEYDVSWDEDIFGQPQWEIDWFQAEDLAGKHIYSPVDQISTLFEACENHYRKWLDEEEACYVDRLANDKGVF